MHPRTVGSPVSFSLTSRGAGRHEGVGVASRSNTRIKAGAAGGERRWSSSTIAADARRRDKARRRLSEMRTNGPILDFGHPSDRAPGGETRSNSRGSAIAVARRIDRPGRNCRAAYLAASLSPSRPRSWIIEAHDRGAALGQWVSPECIAMQPRSLHQPSSRSSIALIFARPSRAPLVIAAGAVNATRSSTARGWSRANLSRPQRRPSSTRSIRPDHSLRSAADRVERIDLSASRAFSQEDRARPHRRVPTVHASLNAFATRRC